MNICKKHIFDFFLNLLVMAGLLCLNLHSLTHLTVHQADSHQSGADSVPVNKISDDCVLCVVSASGFADLGVQPFHAVQTETGQILLPGLASLSYQTFSVTTPRAPPVS